MTYILFAFVVLLAWFAFERQRQIYDQMIAMLEADRDAARNEAKVFRGLLFPVINKAEANSGDVRGASPQEFSGEGSSTPARTSPKGASRRRPLRISTRDWFNQVRKGSNTPQIKTDALAQAIERVQSQQREQSQKKEQEKSHV